MASKNRVAKTATEGVKILWEDKFFREWKKMGAVEKALASRENHFPRAALDMALKRAKHLTRRGTTGNYEYIQQYPYVPEDDKPEQKKGGTK
jgi:hypothetical protein